MNITVNTDSELIKDLITKFNVSNVKDEKLKLLTDLEYYVHSVIHVFFKLYFYISKFIYMLSLITVYYYVIWVVLK